MTKKLRKKTRGITLATRSSPSRLSKHMMDKMGWHVPDAYAVQQCFKGSCLAEARTHGHPWNLWAFAGKYPAAAGIKMGKAAKFDPPGCPGIEFHHSLSPMESRPCQQNHQNSTSSLLQALWRPFPARCRSRRAGSACNACAPMHWQAPSYSMHHHYHLHTHACSPAASQQLWPCPATLTEGLTTGMLLFCPLTQQLRAEGRAKCACSPSQATTTASP